MPSTIRTPGLITALAAFALISASRAQNASAPTAEPVAAPAADVAPVVDPAKAAASAAVAAAETPAAPKRDRVMSDEVAATLATGMPKYSPPPKPVEPKPEEEQADLRETDQPRNKIIRLPKYMVTEPKPPVFRERDLHTKSELSDLALKRYAGLKLGNLGGLNQPTALLMYQEQERLENMAGLKDEARTAKRSGNAAGAEYILRENNRTNYRPSDFGWNSDSPDSGTRK